MQISSHNTRHRLLIIDDNPTIHEDITKILCPASEEAATRELAEALFGNQPKLVERTQFQIDSAFQGQEGLAKVEAALSEGKPYTLAFVDVRMPPGWDGIETIRRIWETYPELQFIICTAYSDHSWEDIIVQLGHSDSLVILKKPFDNIEVLQLAHALAKKWELSRENRQRMDRLDELVIARTAALSEANEQLQSEIARRAGVEAALRASEERFHKAFQAATMPMAILHLQTLWCLEANDNFVELTGRAVQDILGHAAGELFQHPNSDETRQLLALLRGNKHVRNHPCLIRRPDGDARETLISLEPVMMGGEDCIVIAMQDVTELHKLESHLRQAQKMEAIGQLAAGVAHDFNNLLTIIQCHASLHRENLDGELSESIDEIKLAADRAAVLTRQLLSFSRQQIIKRRPLNLLELIERLLPLMKRVVGESMIVEHYCEPSLPAVFADETNMDQILINLVVNARDATPADGKITIHAKLATLDAADAGRCPDARPGQFVRLSVSDTGTGIDPKILSRIFEPFFTTKPQGKGTGLGLATVYGIAKQHEGWVEVDSKVNSGSTFHVFLPVSDAPVAVKAGPDIAASAPDRQIPATILVVEDEISLRTLMSAGLTKRGYHVLQAANGVQAEQIWRSASEPIDLLITDMVMPKGLTGSALAARLLNESKQLRVLYISGHSMDAIENSELLEEGANFLPKPFTTQRLFQVVEQRLKGPPEKNALNITKSKPD